jgi:hypothetical protein
MEASPTATTVETASTTTMETASATTTMPAATMLRKHGRRSASDYQRGAQHEDQSQEIGVFHFGPPTDFHPAAPRATICHTTFDSGGV